MDPASTAGFGVSLPRLGLHFCWGGHDFCAHPSALSLSPARVWLLVGMSGRCGAEPAAGGESSSPALQPTPIPTVASVPKPTVGNKSLSPRFRLLDPALRPEMWPAGPSPRCLGRRLSRCPSLPRKMETGGQGTFLRRIQLCPLPDYHRDIILTCK